MYKLFLFVILLVFSLTGCDNSREEAYLFSFFQNNGEDGLHLAYSLDGLNWTALKNNTSFLSPTAGKDKLMRDPCIIKGRDGKFHMVWTVSWNEQGIGYANSSNLMDWSEQRYLPVMEHEPQARNCWAPELYYDDSSDQYMIYWATTIPGRFPETDTSGDDGYNHRMYYTLTKDFVEFSPTKLLYDHGFNVIDATIHKIGEEYVMFLKNEIKHPDPEKNIRIARSKSLTGPYSKASEAITVNWVEGPTAIEINEKWVVFYDQYTRHEMGAIQSSDLEHWEDISDQIHFPEGTRHGTVFKVQQSVLDKLLKLSE